MAIVFKVLCPVASFDVFDYMSLEELPEQLQSLVTSHFGPKVVIAPQQIVQIIDSLSSCETAIIGAEVRPVPSQRQASTEQFNGFIPLQRWETHVTEGGRQLGVTNAEKTSATDSEFRCVCLQSSVIL